VTGYYYELTTRQLFTAR